MGGHNRPRISVELAGGAIVAIILGLAHLTWLTRSFFVLVAFGLIWHVAWRIPRHIILRLLAGCAASLILFAVTWEPIWTEFETTHPAWISKTTINADVDAFAGTASSVAATLNQSWILALLSIIIVLILAWWWGPFRKFRRDIKWSWRRVLGEEIWIDRENAEQILAESDWGKLKRPSQSILSTLGLSSFTATMNAIDSHPKDMIRYRRFISLTLDSFAASNPHSVKIMDGKTVYSQAGLQKFVLQALDNDVISKFGSVPNFTID